MAFLENAAAFLTRLGLVDVVLPFILVFTIMLALLDRTRVLGTENGKPKTRLNAMVAFVIAFFAIVSLQEIIAVQAFTQVVSVGVVVVLVLLMLVGLLGGSVPSKLLMWLGGIICAVGAVVILNRLGLLPSTIGDIANMTWGPPIAIVVALFAVGWFVFREKPAGGKAKATKESRAAKSERPEHIHIGPEELKGKGKGPEGIIRGR